MRDNLNETIKAVGKESKILFGLIDASIGGTAKIRKIIDTSQSVSGCYETILEQLESFRNKSKNQFAEVFAPSFDINRFEDLINIDKKFSVYTDNDDNNNDPIESITEINEGAGELVLF